MRREELVEAVMHRPWSANGTGPDSWSCHHLFGHVQRELFGIEVELRDVVLPVEPTLRQIMSVLACHRELDRWQEIPCDPMGVVQAQDGAGVLMARSGDVVHIGTWLLPERRVLHADQKCGVSLDSLATLKTKCWLKISFWERK